MDYRREIDGLRTLAVLPVVFFHAGFQLFSGGYVGVDVFFVISGYLITSIIAAELQAGNFSLLGFYDRRARRILPALVVVVLACLPFAWFWLLPSDLKEFSEGVVSVFTFSSNILFWRTSGYFDTDSELKPLLHTWSLAVEEQYYVFFPLLLAWLWRFGQRLTLLALGVLACVSLALGQWGSTNDPSAAFYLLPTRGWELLFGAGAALLLARGTMAQVGQLARELGSALGLLLIAGSIFLYKKDTPFPGVYALAPTAGAALIILLATPQTLVGRILGSRLAVGIGLVSYSTYLWHQPLLAFARHRGHAEPGSVLMAGLAVLSVLLGYLSWRFVERPFRNRRQFSRAQIFQLGAGASALFIGLGVAGVLTTGFVDLRYQGEERYRAALQKREMGHYVARRFKESTMKAFDPADPRRRVLIIGDSFGQDLVNAIAEARLDRFIQIATRHIGHECGNLFIERSRLVDKISPEARPACEGRSLVEDERLRALILAADEVWFAARWLPWQAEMISESVANLATISAKPVRVFGRKDFGKVDLKAMLAADPAQRHQMRGDAAAITTRSNALLKASLPADIYVDTQQLLCSDAVEHCRLFVDGGQLLSYDGGHLTEMGARYLGLKLAIHGALVGNWPARSANGEVAGAGQ